MGGDIQNRASIEGRIKTIIKELEKSPSFKPYHREIARELANELIRPPSRLKQKTDAVPAENENILKSLFLSCLECGVSTKREIEIYTKNSYNLFVSKSWETLVSSKNPEKVFMQSFRYLLNNNEEGDYLGSSLFSSNSRIFDNLPYITEYTLMNMHLLKKIVPDYFWNGSATNNQKHRNAKEFIRLKKEIEDRFTENITILSSFPANEDNYSQFDCFMNSMLKKISDGKNYKDDILLPPIDATLSQMSKLLNFLNDTKSSLQHIKKNDDSLGLASLSYLNYTYSLGKNANLLDLIDIITQKREVIDKFGMKHYNLVVDSFFSLLDEKKNVSYDEIKNAFNNFVYFSRPLLSALSKLEDKSSKINIDNYAKNLARFYLMSISKFSKEIFSTYCLESVVKSRFLDSVSDFWSDFVKNMSILERLNANPKTLEILDKSFNKINRKSYGEFSIGNAWVGIKLLDEIIEKYPQALDQMIAKAGAQTDETERPSWDGESKEREDLILKINQNMLRLLKRREKIKDMNEWMDLYDCSRYNSDEIIFLDKISYGRQGSVYLVNSALYGKKKALKVLNIRPRQFNDYEEFRGVDGLEHPNLVKLLDVSSKRIKKMTHYEEQPVMTILMDYVEGDTLRGIISKNPRGLAKPEVINYSNQILNGLTFLNENKRKHCDLKPENIKLNEVGTIKILDFGHSVEYSVDKDGVTRAYGGASDLFSFALILYEMITGKHLILGRQYKGEEDKWDIAHSIKKMYKSDGMLKSKYMRRILSKTPKEFHEPLLMILEYNSDKNDLNELYERVNKHYSNMLDYSEIKGEIEGLLGTEVDDVKFKSVISRVEQFVKKRQNMK